MFDLANPSEEIIYLLSFSFGSSFLLGKTLCSLYNELMNSKEEKENKALRYMKP